LKEIAGQARNDGAVHGKIITSCQFLVMIMVVFYLYMQISHKCQYAITAYDKIILGECMYKRIRNLREDKDLTQKHISAVFNIAQTTCFRYENGILDISIATLIKIADFHRTSIDYLVGRTNEKKPYC